MDSLVRNADSVEPGEKRQVSLPVSAHDGQLELTLARKLRNRSPHEAPWSVTEKIWIQVNGLKRSEKLKTEGKDACV